jgi:hypothetical protein
MTRSIYCLLTLLFLFSHIHSQTKDTTTQRQTSSVIQFTVQKGDTAVVIVYNMVGAFMVKKTFHRPGSFRLSLEGFHLPSGIYLVQIKTAHSRIVKKAYVLP